MVYVIDKDGRRNQGPRAVNGFQRFSKCVHNGKEAIITALRSDGRFKLEYCDGTSRDKIASRNIMLVEHARTRIYTRRISHSTPMQA